MISFRFMKEYYDKYTNSFSGIIAGIIIFHTSVVAPLVFKKSWKLLFISNLIESSISKVLFNDFCFIVN